MSDPCEIKPRGAVQARQYLLLMQNRQQRRASAVGLRDLAPCDEGLRHRNGTGCLRSHWDADDGCLRFFAVAEIGYLLIRRREEWVPLNGVEHAGEGRIATLGATEPKP